MTQSLDVPAAPALLRDFVNTLDIETGEDVLTSPEAVARWLAGRALIPPGGRASSGDHESALSLREALRTALTGHHDGDGSGTYDALDGECRAYAVRVAVDTGGPSLEPLGEGVERGLASIVAAIVASGADGTWSRLKVCPEERCQWAFVDTSKNRSRTWCTMRICGNRRKTRSYRARRRAGVETERAGVKSV